MATPPTLPDMSLPIPASCHPAIDQIECDAQDWMADRIPSDAAAHLAKTRAGRIAARTTDPRAPRRLVDPYARFLLWAFWLDDEFADELPADSPAQAPAIASVLDILDTGRGTGAAGQAMEATLKEISADLAAILPHSQFTRWQEQMRIWLSSLTLQNALRAAPQPPTIAVYQAVRRYTVCSYPSITLIDATRDPRIGWAEWHDPDLAVLRRHASHVVGWHNDVFSYFTEKAYPGRFWNLPAVHAAHGLSPDQALDQAAREVVAEFEQFQTQERAIASRLTATQRCHIDSLKSWMRACHDWHLEAVDRYMGWANNGWPERHVAGSPPDPRKAGST